MNIGSLNSCGRVSRSADGVNSKELWGVVGSGFLWPKFRQAVCDAALRSGGGVANARQRGIAACEGQRRRLIFGIMESTNCSICDKPERDCKCERYCCICVGQYGVRLCSDGLYYCTDCREACQILVVDAPNRD